MNFPALDISRILADAKASLAQKFMKERIHDLETVWIADIIAEQDIILEKKPVIRAAIEKDQPVFQQLVERREIFAKQGPASFADDVFFRVGNHLCNLLSDDANDAPAGGLQFRQLSLDYVGLLAALKMLPALTNPLLAF